MNGNSKKRKKLFIAVGCIFALLIALIAVFVAEVNRYADTHTWATVAVSGEMHADTDEAFVESHEYLKGDTIAFGNVTLEVTNITTDGTVTFSVQRGELYNETGEAIQTGSIGKEEPARYKIAQGTVSLTVTDNRYQ